MHTEKIKNVIDNFWENMPEKYFDNSFTIEHSEIGYTESVILHIWVGEIHVKINIWDSENNQLKWIEEKNDYEDFRVYLKRKMNEIKKSIDTFKTLI